MTTEKRKGKVYLEDELFSEVRKKYGEALESIYGCQRLLIKILRENNGHILTNRIFYMIDEICQDMILKAEQMGLPFAEKYRARQDRIERIVDKLNQPDLPKDITKRQADINIIMKNKYYEKKRYKCHLDPSEYEPDSGAGWLGDD